MGGSVSSFFKTIFTFILKPVIVVFFEKLPLLIFGKDEDANAEVVVTTNSPYTYTSYFDGGSATFEITGIAYDWDSFTNTDQCD